jgi:hypothetical protein
MASEPVSADSGTEAAGASTNTGARVHEFGRKPCPTMIGAQHRMTLGASEFGNTSLTGTTSWSR